MKIVIINGSARKGNTLATISALMKGEAVINTRAELAKEDKTMEEIEALGRNLE